MARVVRQSESEPVVLEKAAELCRRLPLRDNGAKIAAVRDFLERKLQFLADPVHTELLRTPVYMLNRINAVGRIQADCDDAALLGASLLSSVGVPCRFVAVEFAALPGPLLHVWADAWDGKDWRDLDVTRPRNVPLAAIKRRVMKEV